MEERFGSQIIRADVPLAEMFGYSTTLRSMSQDEQPTAWSSTITRKRRVMWRMKSSPAARKAKQRSRVRREASYPGYSGTSAQAR